MAWPDLLSAIGSSGRPACRTAKILLGPGRPAAVREGELVLELPPGNARNFQNSGTAEPLLRDALADRFGGKWKVSVVLKSAGNDTIQLPPDEAPSVEDSTDSAADGERARAYDPVAVAMEALGAQIVDEREAG